MHARIATASPLRRLALLSVGLVVALAAVALAVPGPVEASGSTTSVVTRTTSLGVAPKLQYCGNGRVEARNPRVTTVVVVIHGAGRGACSYARSTMKAAAASGAATTTLVVAPHFLTDSDPHTGRMYWSSSGWKIGDTSHDSGDLSSFAVVDRLLAGITKARYPKVRRVVVAGHSAGGQFVNRYQAATASDRVTRYVVANPSSYLYFGAQRFSGSNLRALTAAEASACPDFNEYKYGLTDRNSYTRRVSERALRDRFARRSTILLLGTADTSRVDNLDTSCAGDWQGTNRYMRGHLYHDRYLAEEFGNDVLSTHALVDVPRVGHSWGDVVTSPQGRAAVFGR